ncbi:MAG: hypothetical protein BYD32DRAFT_426577 [Podila humilis]|nr:MAG: hypothetical protein BYD32DRAFT_426577 [Podila humilis]
MSNFDDELNGYIQARSESSIKEKAREQFETALATLPYPHPESFNPTPDAPVFAQNPSTQMWHDGSTGTFSYYDVASGTYIPVEGPDSPYPMLNHDNTATYSESYGHPDQQYPETGASTYEAPPESDATLRLCVLSSSILKVGGVIMVDGSGVSFGRDKPLSGQGKRVRMVEMEVSRFHANIYLDRQQAQAQAQEETYHNICPEGSSAPETGVSSSTDSPHLPIDTVTLAEHSSVPVDDEDEQGAIVESPSTRQSSTPPSQLSEPLALDMTRDDPNEDHEDGEIPDSPGNTEKEADVNGAMEAPPSVSAKPEEVLYREYQEQMEQYQQYYHQQQQGAMPAFVDTFQIIDCGSTHGTLLNGQRLSTAKTASQPFALKHMDQLQLGSTMFEIHAHEGRICASCQVKDDNEITVLDDKERERDSAEAPKNKGFIGDLKLNMELERVEEMNRLRKKWAGPSNNSNNKRSGKNLVCQDGSLSGGSSPNSDNQRDYVDRAAKRRLHNPDHSRPVPTSGYPTVDEPVTGFHIPVAATNKGHAMLSKMGWKAGTGLGATRQGVVEPVQLVVADNKAGVGSATLQSQGVAAARKPETQAEIARRKARERYSQLR